MRISGAESLVMETLWRESPLTAEDVMAGVKDQNWSEGTVKTLLNRLLTKGAIKARKDGRRFLYTPAVERAAYVQAESQGLLDRLFDGRLAPLVNHFSSTGKLSATDIAELRGLLDEIERGEG